MVTIVTNTVIIIIVTITARGNEMTLILMTTRSGNRSDPSDAVLVIEVGEACEIVFVCTVDVALSDGSSVVFVVNVSGTVRNKYTVI